LNLLRPSNPHPSQILWRGALISSVDLKEENGHVSAWFCNECSSALQKGKSPRYAIANGLWIGEIPFELATLTLPEQMLIARHFPRCFVVKLYPCEGSQHLSEDQFHRGIKGNVSLYELNTEEIVKMLEGQLMPNPSALLASVLAITFVGSKKLSKDWLKSTFRVRRRAVYEALTWLQANNKLYSDIVVDEDRLSSLPEDGIPDEILATIRQQKDDSVIDNKQNSYIPPSTENRMTSNDAENGGKRFMLYIQMS
jgi:hypothetical protein